MTSLPIADFLSREYCPETTIKEAIQLMHAKNKEQELEPLLAQAGSDIVDASKYLAMKLRHAHIDTVNDELETHIEVLKQIISALMKKHFIGD